MRQLRLQMLGGLALLLGGLQCSGKAVMDLPLGTGGASSSGTSSGSSSGTSSGSSSGTSSGTSSTSSGTVSQCGEACAVVADCYLGDDCTELCDDVESSCADERDYFLQCFVANAPPCMMPSYCQPQLDDYLQCVEGPPSGTTGCSVGGDGSCSCQASLPKTGAQLEASCNPQSGTSQCFCWVNGELVGSCIHPGAAMEGCDPLEGCCASLFFVPY